VSSEPTPLAHLLSYRCPSDGCQKIFPDQQRAILHARTAQGAGHSDARMDSWLLTQLRRFADCLESVPTQRTIDAISMLPSKNTYTTSFGSWNNALIEAGMIPQRSIATPAILVDELQRVAETTDRQHVRRLDIERHGSFDPSTYLNHFNSWKHALETAGLEYNNVDTVSRAELLTALDEVGEHVGHVPGPTDVARHGRFSRKPYRARWDNGVWGAGVDNGWEFLTDRVRRPNTYGRDSYLERMNNDWDRLRVTVVSRDEYCCRVCETDAEDDGARLEVHHIDPIWRAEGILSYGDADRLITLCSTCHRCLEGMWPDADVNEFEALAREHYLL